MNGNIASAIISSVTTVLCVVYTSHRQLKGQSRRIDRDNRAALSDQTDELKQHLGKEQP